MKVRSANILDLGRIEQIYREGGAQISEVAPPARLWSLLSYTLSALLPLAQETLIVVAEEEGRVVGFVQALPVGTTLQVLNLCLGADADPEDVAPRLIEHLSEQALTRGVHRLVVRLELADPLTPVFRMQGFRQYATEHVLYSDKARAKRATVPAGLRPMKSRDHRVLYQLYRKVTPMGVAQVEAPNYGEWRQLTGRSEAGEQLVVDRVELVGWVAIRKSAETRPHQISFLALPEAPLPDELADYAISELGTRPEPAWCSLRHYDAHMIDALRGRGFGTLLTQSLLVKELALRVPLREKGLVPSFG